MYILTDGKNYVMENPYKQGRYIKTTSVCSATKFTNAQARKILKYKQFKHFASVVVKNDSQETKPAVINPSYKGKKDIYIGENDIDFDENIITKIMDECNRIMEISGFELQEINNYKIMLYEALSKVDCASSDLQHALEDYRNRHNGKRPPCDRITKFGYLYEDIRESRQMIKRSIRILDVMENSITNKYSFVQTKDELHKTLNSPYQARTDYYKTALEILG